MLIFHQALDDEFVKKKKDLFKRLVKKHKLFFHYNVCKYIGS